MDGKRINTVPAKRRDMAMVFQSYALYPHKTVAQNMGFALKMQGLLEDEIALKVGEAAEILGLSSLLSRYPKELSGGQRQRVAMGRAIVRAPKVFLFDEPLSNLDAKLRVQMRAEMKELHQRLGTTTVYVTHDQVEAMTLADRVVIMNGGKIAQAGPPLEVFDRPADQFVAGFIGSPSMNFLNGEVKGDTFVTDAGLTLPMPSRNPHGVRAGRAVFGIRPSDLGIGPEGLSATVSVVEPTGTETLIKATIGDVSLMALISGRVECAAGEAISLVIDSTKAHIFVRTRCCIQPVA